MTVEQQSLRTIRYVIIVFAAVMLALSVFAWHEGRPASVPAILETTPIPNVTPYRAWVPGPMDYYNECIKLGFGTYRCHNTYLP